MTRHAGGAYDRGMEPFDADEVGCLASALNLDDHGAPASLFDGFAPRDLGDEGDYAPPADDDEAVRGEVVDERPAPKTTSAPRAAAPAAPTKRTRNQPTLRAALLDAARGREVAVGTLPPNLRAKGATSAVVTYADGKVVVLR